MHSVTEALTKLLESDKCSKKYRTEGERGLWLRPKGLSDAKKKSGRRVDGSRLSKQHVGRPKARVD
jgi:hypothetical protein